MSMFTGLLPSEHGAHFQSMGYHGTEPTIAELLAKAGYHTEIVTRNSVFDGSLPGVTRGFAENRVVLAERSRGLNPVAIMLAAPPRFRRQVRSERLLPPAPRSAFPPPLQPRDDPADPRRSASHMAAHRRARRPYFSSPISTTSTPPTRRTPSRLPRWRSAAAVGRTRRCFVLPYLGGPPSAGVPATTAAVALLGRYHDLDG
jgi:hypothetical protein